MRWRILRLDWAYAFGELIIVTVGVFIALTINQWNDEREDRAEEADAISGILSDLEADSRWFDFVLDSLDDKKASLLRVRAALAAGVTGDPHESLTDIADSANFGWSQGLANRSTYDDLLASGKLGVIADPGIRQGIASYYRNYDEDADRIDERETAYPDLTYQLVPRDIIRAASGEVSDSALQSGLSDNGVKEIVSLVRKSGLADYVTAEINVAQFMRAITVRRQQQATSLTELLEDYETQER
jgi:hypothetical protein